MRARLIFASIAGSVLLIFATPDSAQVLNASRDLVALGISSTNLTPDTPQLDAGALLAASLGYARSHGISRIVTDPGKYYLQTLQYSTLYCDLHAADGITFDFQGAEILLANGRHTGLALTSSANATIENLVIDAVKPPFTQLRVTSVDTKNRRVGFQPLPGWFDPSEFNSSVQPGFESFHVFFFRGPQPLFGVTWLTPQLPFAPSTLTILDEGVPWTAEDVIGRIEPGDTAVVIARGGGPAILVDGCATCSLRNVRIYSSGDVGVFVNQSTHTLLERVYMMPAPASDRLVSTNADGLSISAGHHNTIRLCRSIRTLDDGFSPHSLIFGTVTAIVDPHTVDVARVYGSQLSDRARIAFEDRKSGNVVLTATTTAAKQIATDVYELSLDGDTTSVKPGAAVYSLEPADRGDATSIERSTVQDQIFARGMTLWGLMNSSVTGNYIRHVHMCAIMAPHSLYDSDWMTAPVVNLSIVNNVIEMPDSNISPGLVANSAAIELFDDFPTAGATTSHQDVHIRGNFVANAPRSAVMAKNVDGGDLSANAFVNVNDNPHFDGYWQDTYDPFRSEFEQPIVLGSDSNFSVEGNDIRKDVPAIVRTSDARSLVAYPPGSEIQLWSPAIGGKTDLRITMHDADGNSVQIAYRVIDSNSVAVTLPPNTALGGAFIVAEDATARWSATLFVDSQDNFETISSAPVARRRAVGH